MKKTLLLLIAFVFISSFCSVQLASAKTDEIKSCSGKIEQVAPALPMPPRMAYCKIVVSTDKGEKLTIFVMRTTKITSVDGKPMPVILPSLRKNKNVEIKYLTTEKGNSEATLIHYTN